MQGVFVRGRQALFAAREKRIKPDLDDKIQANWNGMMISAFALSYQVFGYGAHLEAASRAARFVLDGMRQDDGRLFHIWKDGQARFNGYQDDYACMVAALIDLYEATFDRDWLDGAKELADVMIDQFWDEVQGGFFFTGRDHETLIVRSKNPYDNATPSGNSVGAMALMRLGILAGQATYWDMAGQVVRTFLPYMRELPSGFGQMVCTLDFYVHRPVEIAIVGGAPDGPLARLARGAHLSNRVLCGAASPGEALDSGVPLLQDKTAVEGRETAYVCRNFACSAPVTDADVLEKMLVSVRAGGGC